MGSILEYPEARRVIVCGDIHGDFEPLVYKLCVMYGCTNTLLVVAGDCGFGFERPGYYDTVFAEVERRLRKANNWVVFVRGNHDDPAYFRERRIDHLRWRTVPDYSILHACDHTILCVGGAVSVDRVMRIREDERRREGNVPCYWSDEPPVFNPEELAAIPAGTIDTVVTHTAPSFCELTSHLWRSTWAEMDDRLQDDVLRERETMDKLYEALKKAGHPLKAWLYGHFHHSWNGTLEGTHFTMLDIMEFEDLR